MVLGDDGLIGAPGFLIDMHAVLLNGIRQHIEEDRLPEAARECKKLRNVELLRPAVAKIERSIRTRILLPGLMGSAAGAIISSAALVPILRHWRGDSLHVQTLVAGALLGAILCGLLVSGIILFIVPWYFKNRRSRLLGAAGATLAAIILCCGVGVLMGYDPARSLDQTAMETEYREHFPFGLRTLASKEDIDFLTRLLAKYEPIGVDVQTIRVDLATLERKLEADADNIVRIHRIGQDIENLQNYGKDKRRWPGKKTRTRIGR